MKNEDGEIDFLQRDKEKKRFNCELKMKCE
jgi:hypothetical protein